MTFRCPSCDFKSRSQEQFSEHIDTFIPTCPKKLSETREVTDKKMRALVMRLKGLSWLLKLDGRDIYRNEGEGILKLLKELGEL